MEVRLEAHQVIEKTVKSSGNSGRVYVPKEWIGKRVKVLLLESLDKVEIIRKV
jgi:putative transposon-encoded protein